MVIFQFARLNNQRATSLVISHAGKALKLNLDRFTGPFHGPGEDPGGLRNRGLPSGEQGGTSLFFFENHRKTIGKWRFTLWLCQNSY